MFYFLFGPIVVRFFTIVTVELLLCLGSLLEVLRMFSNQVGDLNMQEVEESVKARTKGEAGAAKTLCMPFEHETLLMVSNTLAEGAHLLYIVLWAFQFSFILCVICVICVICTS